MRRGLVAALSLILAGCGQKQEEPAKPVVAVKVARAETATVALVVRATATVYPREQANIAARITAPIRELRARMGENVGAGQTLAVLENRDLAAQRQEAEAMVSDAANTLERLRSGTLPGDVDKAQAQLASAQAALDQAQKIHERRSQLYKEGAIPGRDLLVSETDLAKARADFALAKKSLDLLENQSRERDIKIAQNRLEQAQARAAAARAQLDFTDIRAPFGGVITAQSLYAGDMAKPDTPIFTLMDLSAVVARAQIAERDAPGVKPGQPCRFEPNFTGRVTAVSKAVDPARRTVEVWCEIPNPQRALRGNVFGDVEIHTGDEPGSVVVPLAAVQFVEGSSKGTALVVDAKRQAHKREVEAGRTFDGKVQIRSGLAAGETVVVEGGYGLADGTEVRW